jgi:hypothetical protein
MVRNPYRNLKSEKSQDYAPEPQRNSTFMNSSFGVVVVRWIFDLTRWLTFATPSSHISHSFCELIQPPSRIGCSQSWPRNHYFVTRYRYSLVMIMFWKVYTTQEVNDLVCTFNAYRSSPFFQKTVFFPIEYVLAAPPLNIFGGVSNFGTSVNIESSLQFLHCMVQKSRFPPVSKFTPLAKLRHTRRFDNANYFSLRHIFVE